MTESFTAKVKVENRRFPRVRFKLGIHYAEVQKGELPKPLQSLAEDVGVGGMAMYSNKKLTKGQLLTVNIYLPPAEKYINTSEIPVYLKEECEPVTLFARVVWCHQDKKHGFRAGIKFFDVDKKNAKQFKHFLVEYELDEPIS